MGNLKGKAYPRDTYLKMKSSWVFRLKIRLRDFIEDLKKNKIIMETINNDNINIFINNNTIIIIDESPR